ncbi:hypothetical protein [Lacticaseibacillus songhuajiangensis]|uniref:hypothetical protein n=1 Tax=Lacticaseibacillus songhuajiangensis TaxID=1296539 RepID=UPI000F79E4F1|nr:hypothetical protein [Lacticaseibacillus songhuajiangensis]
MLKEQNAICCWLKWCNDNEIKPWLFDFKQFFRDSVWTSDKINDETHLNEWLLYKFEKKYSENVKKVPPLLNCFEKGKKVDKDPDKIARPIYKVLGWIDSNSIHADGDQMNSFQTTFTQLFAIKSSNRGRTNGAPFSDENLECYRKHYFEQIPEVSDLFKEMVQDLQQSPQNSKQNIFNEFAFRKNELIFKNLKEFAGLTHSIGNFIVMPVKYNLVRGSAEQVRDYWDLSLQVIHDLFYSAGDIGRSAWKNFVEQFYLQPFVRRNDYSVGELWTGHLTGQIYPQSSVQVEEFYYRVNMLIEERGKWITRILCEKLDSELDSETKKFYLKELKLGSMDHIRFYDEIIEKE